MVLTSTLPPTISRTIRTTSNTSKGSNIMFGQGTAGDFSLGAGAFSNTLSNGYGNDPNPAASNSSAFDLSDFPSLGGGGGGSNASSGGGGQQALRQQLLAQQQAQVQQKSSELYRLTSTNSANAAAANVNDGGWPALGGGGGGTTSSNGGNANSGSSSPFLLRRTESNPEKAPVSRTSSTGSAPANSGGGGLYMGGIGGSSNTGGSVVSSTSIGGSTIGGGEIGGNSGLGGNVNDGASIGSSGGNSVDGVLGNLGGLNSLAQQQQAKQLQQQRSSTPSTIASTTAPGSNTSGTTVGGSTVGSTSSNNPSGPTPNAGPGSAMRGDYGLLGLLQLIRMPDCDRKALALGSELSLFTASFTEKQSKEPHYQLPMCYYMQPPALKTGHLSKFQLETLFYIFYSLPKDVLQAYSAQELYTRDWRYHGELQLWFKEIGPTDNIPGAANSNTTNGQPQHMYFDINSWERRLCNNANMASKNITSGFLSEEDVRVKFPGSS